MEAQDILSAIQIGEDKDWEFKAAKGGLPETLWSTYSAMANTDGGVIVLGVEEREGAFEPRSISDPPKLVKTFWDLVNNPQKVSHNLLENGDVTVEKVVGTSLIVIRIPRANRFQRPVYIGSNPLTGTYRRFQEGDYKCKPDEVQRMLADRTEAPADSRILKHFGLADLDPKSLQQYRNRFSARSPDHPWLAKDQKGLLEKLGGWRTDRAGGESGLTVAGLLMFGKDEAIQDVHALPRYEVNYRERFSDDPQVRWTDLLTTDGTWVGNLFQFYQTVILRLYDGLKVPFQYQTRSDGGLFRKDETIVHEAIREALVNALIHADYSGEGGVIVEKRRDRIELSNPGLLLISMEQLLKGGVSECRNRAIQKMFFLIGGGEKQGSGIDKIWRGWTSQHWRTPLIAESTRPDRVQVTLSMQSLLPEDSLERLRTRFGPGFPVLPPDEIQALVTADIEGEVSNTRLRQFSDRHSAEITKSLQNLVSQGFLVKDGYGRWASYHLPPSISPGSSQTPLPDGQTPLPAGQTPLPDGQTPLPVGRPTITRLPRKVVRQKILQFCLDEYRTPKELTAFLGRKSVKRLRDDYLTPMVQENLLQRKYPDELQRTDQAYTTVKREDEHE